MIGAMFYHPVTLLSDLWQLLLVVPLCVSVSIVYKTVRTQNLPRLWREVLIMLAQVLGGIIVLGALLWATHACWPA